MSGPATPRRFLHQRTALAWLLVFGLLIKSVLTAMAGHPAGLDTSFAIVCQHDEGQSGRTDAPAAPGELDLNDCCSTCALLEAGHAALPPPLAPELRLRVATSTRIDIIADVLPAALRQAAPYSSRAPPRI
ncbi:DUF2946 family protein [Bradyrhizobium sp. 2TAF24]|uniref:DUF2946 family protein n=1 Tax=Bradyrhizobium sp. 2TAF24 TaxID=3233011 RepID=UPI003F8F8836